MATSTSSPGMSKSLTPKLVPETTFLLYKALPAPLDKPFQELTPPKIFQNKLDT
jgi:hypothetical protein